MTTTRRRRSTSRASEPFERPAAPARTAHVGYMPSAKHWRGGPPVAEKYHAICDYNIASADSGGLLELWAGEPLCAAVGLVYDPEPGLFAPPVNCRVCLGLLTSAEVVVTDDPAADIPPALAGTVAAAAD